MISNRTAQRDCSPSVGHVTGGETVLVTLHVGHVTSGGKTRSWSLWSLSLYCRACHRRRDCPGRSVTCPIGTETRASGFSAYRACHRRTANIIHHVSMTVANLSVPIHFSS